MSHTEREPHEHDGRDHADSEGDRSGHDHGERRDRQGAEHAESGAHQHGPEHGGHSHDAADQIDDALEADAAGRRALFISLIGLGVTAVIQAVVVLSSLAAYLAIDRLIHPRPVAHLWYVAAAALIGFAGNEIVARYRTGVGRQIGSAALVADGVHARTDGFTSLVVLLGAGGVALGWREADPIIGLVITVAILGVLRSAVRQVGARLMDAVDPGLVEKATAAVTSVTGVESVRELRIRWIGHTLRAEADVTVAANITLIEAHELAHHAEEHLLHDVPRLTGATIHASPAGVHAVNASS